MERDELTRAIQKVLMQDHKCWDRAGNPCRTCVRRAALVVAELRRLGLVKSEGRNDDRDSGSERGS